MSRTNRILVIVTSSGEYEKAGYRTGLWLGELTHFYDVAEQAGFELTIASIQGGPVPLDPESLAHAILGDLGTDKRYADRLFMDKLKDTGAVTGVDVADYDAIYLTGGHGVMFDFPQSPALESSSHSSTRPAGSSRPSVTGRAACSRSLWAAASPW